MKELNAVIIDDEPNARTFLAGQIGQYCPNVTIIGEASGVQEGLELLSNSNPELVFLDVKMKDGTGFDLLDQFKDTEPNFAVIFTTAFDQYAVKAIRNSALDYLLKPVDGEELKQAVGRYIPPEDLSVSNVGILLENIRELNEKEKKIVIPTAEKTWVVRVKEILRCESDMSYTTFYLANGQSILSSRTLKETEEQLPANQFLRVHKSHLINVDFITAFEREDGGVISLEDGSRIPVSRRRVEDVKAFLSRI